MLKFRYIFLLVHFTIVGFILFNLIVFPVSFWYLLPFMLIFLGILVYGSAYVSSNFYLDTICSVPSEKAEIALTFDDGPDTSQSLEVAAILEKYHIKAAFFCIGKKIEENPEIVRILDQKGHLIGNHTFSHSNYFDFWFSSKMKKEIVSTSASIENILEKKSLLFRPPYGVTNPALMRALKNLNLLVIGWSLRSLDSSSKNAIETLNRMKKKLKPGDIILLHDTTPFIIEILEDFIPFAFKNGYNFVRLDHLIQKEAYEN